METQLIQLKEGVWEDRRREFGSIREVRDMCVSNPENGRAWHI